jgi:tetratricopeptide (TPR) repeat protein
LDCFDEVLKLNPEFTGGWGDKGLVLNELKRNKEALTCFNRVILLDPADARGYYYKGITIM